MTDKIEQFFRNNNLSEESISIICDYWNTEVVIRKKEYLLRKNQTENYLYFIVSGCVALLVESENKNSVIGFGYENSIITSFISFSTETPSELSLFGALESKVLKISKTDLNTLMERYPEIAKWYYETIEKTLIGHLKRQIELTTLSPKDRYKLFIERSGHLVNSIPLKYISSYLNMTPETLSRVRASFS
ncbi:Crp/Fnr family transcriptional regulator [Kordia sp.]|uniref:Crp/Fnr family transcriptional regulator n=1 Tax=Kordia sp. TaxID=1965332 RepID=UPI003B5AEA04